MIISKKTLIATIILAIVACLTILSRRLFWGFTIDVILVFCAVISVTILFSFFFYDKKKIEKGKNENKSD